MQLSLSLFWLVPFVLSAGPTIIKVAHAPEPTSVSEPPACASSYDVISEIYDEEETESIDEKVFTDADPFECALTGASQVVTFHLDGAAVDPVSGCEYSIARRHKDGGGALNSSEQLSCSAMELHYEVIATPLASDPDCSGLDPIEVDPKIQVAPVGKGCI